MRTQALQPYSTSTSPLSCSGRQDNLRLNSTPPDSVHFKGSEITNAETFFKTFNMLAEVDDARQQDLVEALLRFLAEDQKRTPPQVPLFLSKPHEYKTETDTKAGYTVHLGDSNSPCRIVLQYGEDGTTLYPMVTFYTAKSAGFSAYSSYHYFLEHELRPTPEKPLESLLIEHSKGMKAASDFEKLVEAQSGNADAALCTS